MKSLISLPIIFFLAYQSGFSQAKLRKMPTNLNHPAFNNYAPYVSLDGNSMVYVADVAEDNALTMSYTIREGVNWKDPVILPKWVNNRLNFMTGFALSTDGKTLYLSNMRANGMGGFDLYTSQLAGSSWGEPVNMLLPANSKGHEACPSVSLDGSTMFYMRCEKMDFTKAEGCRILMMKKKPNGQWDEPVDLPGYINTGNSQVPRIMGDGEILIFSSDRLQPNKGGMDLYMTRLTQGKWSSPQSLDFANTPGDDQYVSATSVGLYLLKDARGQRSSELVELLFPPEVRPKSTLKIEGTVTGPSDLSGSFVTVVNLIDQSRVISTKPAKDGSFVTYITHGGWYELSVEPEQDNFTFFSRAFDLRGEGAAMIEKVQATLSPVVAGTLIDLHGIGFAPNSSEVSESSKQELRRLTRLVKGTAAQSFAIEVTLSGYLQDSVRSAPDLTEIQLDTVKIPITYVVDSTTLTRDSLVIKTTYHNNRALKQAKAIEAYLVREGIPQGRLACSGKAEIEALPEKRTTMVRAIVH